jgi:hypothetical protein
VERGAQNIKSLNKKSLGSFVLIYQTTQKKKKKKRKKEKRKKVLASTTVSDVTVVYK